MEIPLTNRDRLKANTQFCLSGLVQGYCGKRGIFKTSSPSCDQDIRTTAALCLSHHSSSRPKASTNVCGLFAKTPLGFLTVCFVHAMGSPPSAGVSHRPRAHCLPTSSSQRQVFYATLTPTRRRRWLQKNINSNTPPRASPTRLRTSQPPAPAPFPSRASVRPCQGLGCGWWVGLRKGSAKVKTPRARCRTQSKQDGNMLHVPAFQQQHRRPDSPLSFGQALVSIPSVARCPGKCCLGFSTHTDTAGKGQACSPSASPRLNLHHFSCIKFTPGRPPVPIVPLRAPLLSLTSLIFIPWLISSLSLSPTPHFLFSLPSTPNTSQSTRSLSLSPPFAASPAPVKAGRVSPSFVALVASVAQGS